MDCKEFQEISGAYALGATTEEEHREVQIHLSQCPYCPHTLQTLQDAVSTLPFSVPSITPTGPLKARLLASIQAETLTAIETRPLRKKNTQTVWWSHWQNRMLALVAVLLLILFSGMTAWNVELQQQLTQITSTATPSVTATIQGTNQAAGVQGVTLYLPQEKMTTLVIHGLPALSETAIYQGWLINDKQPESLGPLIVHNGTATLTFRGDGSGYDIIAVSREPGPEASQNRPQGPVLATGSLAHLQQQLGWRDDAHIQAE